MKLLAICAAHHMPRQIFIIDPHHSFPVDESWLAYDRVLLYHPADKDWVKEGFPKVNPDIEITFEDETRGEITHMTELTMEPDGEGGMRLTSYESGPE